MPDAVAPAAGQGVPLRLVAGADLLLEGLVVLFELGQVALGLGGDLGHPPLVGLDGLAHLAGLVGLDVDHSLGVGLVDLADPLVAEPTRPWRSARAWFSLACFRSSSCRAASAFAFLGVARASAFALQWAFRPSASASDWQSGW